MRELIGSIFRFSWTMSLMGLQQISAMFLPRNVGKTPPGPDVPASSSPAQDPPRSATPAAPPPATGPVSVANPAAVNSGRLNTSRMSVLGEGLAAGVGDFSLSSDSQPWSFAAQMAGSMGASLPLPLIQAPGIGNFVGFANLSVCVSAPMQSTVLENLPPTPVSNVATPEFRLKDALTIRPTQPLIHRANAKQTSANLIWGLLSIVQGQSSTPTQLEYAVGMSPTFTIIELGYYEALEAAINESPDRLPEKDEFLADYSRLLCALKNSGSEILVLNIPDPFDTAYFSSVDTAAKIAKTDASFLTARYGINADDLITLNGLNEIGFQIFGRSLQALPPDSTVSASFAGRIHQRIQELNQTLATLAQENGAVLYDLAALFRRLAGQGYRIGTKTLTGEYLGGFFALNGYYPGRTGQAIIANEILELLNSRYGAGFPRIDLNAVMSNDPAAACRQAEGPLWSSAELQQLPFDTNPELDGFSSRTAEAKPVDGYNNFSIEDNWKQLASVNPPPPPKRPLQLPPGLEQVLPLHPGSSYFGDGISALNVLNPREALFGSTGEFIFGGFAMVDSHLTGSIKIRFAPPVNNVSHFEVSYMGGFSGEDAVLIAPRFFKMPFQKNRVEEPPGMISSGDLNLETAEVSNLTFYAIYSSTALNALRGTNPNFPNPPIIIFKNPSPTNCPPPTPEQQRIYGSAWAEFEQRPEGTLDFTFYGSMFVPLGPGTVWPLNFTGPSGQFATIPAGSTVMHPHLQLSTRPPQSSGQDITDLIPFNTSQEFTLFTHNSAFGDAFHLNADHLGGPAKGRSHLLGRLQIQFGGKTGSSVPIAVRAIPPGGIMAPLPASPISQFFPSRLSPGPQGFNEYLRFPMRNYALDDLSTIDDPFDIAIGALDLKTGRFLNSYLHRAFISQDLIFALLRVEPCTPQSSFFFRGPAVVVRGPRNQRVFRFQGIVHIPYTAGFKFLHPDFATAFTVGNNSALDPFLWFHAIQNGAASKAVLEGGANSLRASTGDEFSFRYLIPADPGSVTPMFEYENHSQQGGFRMHSLAWIDFSHSGTSSDVPAEYDTVTFSGFGFWKKDGIKTLQQVAVQISTSPEKPFIGIQVAEGDISNVNTKPQNELTALP